MPKKGTLAEAAYTASEALKAVMAKVVDHVTGDEYETIERAQGICAEIADGDRGEAG